MSYEVHAVGRLRVKSEGTFAADGTGTLGDYTDVPARENSMTVELMTDSLNPETLVQHLDDYPKEVLGKRSAKLTFTINLAPTGVAANAGTDQVTGALGILLKASMGGESKDRGATVSSATSGSQFVVSDGTNFAAGCAVGRTNAAGHLEVREVESINTGTGAMVLKYAFSATPSTNDVIYRAATYYLTQDPTESLQFIVYGAESDDRWLLLGGQLTSIALSVDPTGASLPNLQMTYEFATYLESDETAGAITGTLAAATYTYYEPIVGHVGHLVAPTVAAPTFNTAHRIHASAIAMTPKFTFGRITSPSGTQTVLRWRRSRVAPVVEGSWTHPYQDLSWFQARDARTDKAVWYQLGVTAGYSILLSAPRVQIVNPQRVADGGGIAATTVNWKGRIDGDVGSSTDDLALSAFRIHLI